VYNLIIIEYDYMHKTIITVTQAARHFADCVNRAHYQNVTFVLVKNGSPVARLVPDGGRICDGRSLANALHKFPLSNREAKTWSRDLRTTRKTVKPPADKWS